MHRVRTKHIILAVAVLFFAVQLIPLNRENPPVIQAQTIYAAQSVPATVQSILQNSCNDCHSNETRWPWYSHVAPVSWLVVHDVHSGRRHVNFSQWAAYPDKKKVDRLEQICDQVTNGDMPDGWYGFVHRGSRLTQEQRESVCEWVESARAALPMD